MWESVWFKTVGASEITASLYSWIIRCDDELYEVQTSGECEKVLGAIN